MKKIPVQLVDLRINVLDFFSFSVDCGIAMTRQVQIRVLVQLFKKIVTTLGQVLGLPNGTARFGKQKQLVVILKFQCT